MGGVFLIKREDVVVRVWFERLKTIFRNFRHQECAVTAIEYGLIFAAVAFAIIAVVFTMGEDLAALTDDIIEYIQRRDPVS
jgi:Flp pilus assembly pilin Flp